MAKESRYAAKGKQFDKKIGDRKRRKIWGEPEKTCADLGSVVASSLTDVDTTRKLIQNLGK